jgi:hypothetical protein
MAYGLYFSTDTLQFSFSLNCSTASRSNEKGGNTINTTSMKAATTSSLHTAN